MFQKFCFAAASRQKIYCACCAQSTMKLSSIPVLTRKASSKIYSIPVKSYVQKMHFLQGVNLHINHSFHWLPVRNLLLRGWLLQYSHPWKFIPIMKRNNSLKKINLSGTQNKSKIIMINDFLDFKGKQSFCKCSTIRLILKLYLQHTLHSRSSNIVIRDEINLSLEKWTNN